MKNSIFIIPILFLMLSCNDDTSYSELPDDKIALGKQIFFDKSLSNPVGQSCATCHSPEKGFSDEVNAAISQGANNGFFSNRNSPMLSYNVFSPQRYYNNEDETYIGGFFYDGRATNLETQMKNPFISPTEMNNGTIENVVNKLKNTPYFDKLLSLYGNPTNSEEIFSALTDAVARYERSPEVNSFTSKFDYVSRGLLSFTADEKAGLNLFMDKAKCAQCHVLDADPNTGKVLFTDFSYDNLGIPKNNTNPFYEQSATINPLGKNYIDLGIGATVNQPQHHGKFKVPTLRNIAVSAPYYHNGSIKTLKEAIHFYNVRDKNTGEFDAPEYNFNVNKTELGDLKLTDNEENQIEKFLNTLTDHYRK